MGGWMGGGVVKEQGSSVGGPVGQRLGFGIPGTGECFCVVFMDVLNVPIVCVLYFNELHVYYLDITRCKG